MRKAIGNKTFGESGQKINDSDSIISFTGILLPYGWLGNMSRHPVAYGGKTWRTTEHLFQAMRYGLDSKVATQIHGVRSPMGAKMCSKKRTNHPCRRVEPMSAEDLDNMRLVLQLKFNQHRDVRDGLLETGNKILVEDVSNRPSPKNLFWGMKLEDGLWMGRNTLGRLWMELREQLRSDSLKALNAEELSLAA